MLKVRLQRVGRKNDPSFRVVLTESKNSTKSGRFIELLGSYNARFGKPDINADRVKYWMSVGAQLSPTVNNLMVQEKFIDYKKINVLPSKRSHKKAEKKEEKASKDSNNILSDTADALTGETAEKIIEKEQNDNLTK